MKLLLIRHADAGDRIEFDRPDSERPLSSKGLKQMPITAQALIKMNININLIITSPYKRALQTAEILHAQYSLADFLESSLLVPDSPVQGATRLLQKYKEVPTVAFVGHEPHLSSLASFLLTPHSLMMIRLKKSGVICLEINHKLKNSPSELLWLMTGKQLRTQAQ